MPEGLLEHEGQEHEHEEHEGASGAGAATPAAPNPLRMLRAARYRREFKKLTGGACLGSDGHLDPEKVKAWQSKHGVDPTGKIHHDTIAAARKAAQGAEDGLLTPDFGEHSKGHKEDVGGGHGGGGHATNHGDRDGLLTPDFGDHAKGQAHGGGTGHKDNELLTPTFVKADAPTGGGGGATPQKQPALGYDLQQLKDAISGNNAPNAVRIAAKSPEQAMTDLAAASLEPTFFALIRGAKPYSTPMRTQLSTIYHKCKLAEKRQLFAAQFSVTLEKSGAQDFSEAELDNLYDQSRLLPPSHVEGQANFVRLMRSTGALAEGTAGGGRITMDAMKNAARYSQVFRHEVGHTVDTTLGAECDKLRLQEAGWTQYGTTDEWITALGGYGDLPKDVQPKVRAAVQAYMGAGNTFNSPTPKFWDTLKLHVTADELKDLENRKTNHLIAACIASEGNCNYFRFQGWPLIGGKAFFINHYYAKGYSIGSVTFSDLKSWGNVAAAFSDKEWFAEVYAEYYKNGVGGAHHAFAGFVETFMQQKVDKLGQKAAPAHGGGTPAVAQVEPPVEEQLPGAGGSSGNHPTVPR